MLFNAVALVVAAAKDDDPLALDAPVCDVPGDHVFQQHGLHSVAGSQLEQPVTEGQLGALDSDERADVAYHRPSRLGDLLFNWFD